jgi:protein gp37
MANATEIQWCDSTVNPVMGCDGCELWGKSRKTCYAGVLHLRHAGKNPGYAPAFEDVTLFPGRMATAAKLTDLTGFARAQKPWLDAYPRLIFVSDMGDALSKAASFSYLESEIIRHATSAHGRRHRWLWLTKRPLRMARFSAWLAERGIAWPTNLWAGTSVTSAKSQRVAPLLKVGDATTVRFLSVEPQHGVVQLSPWLSKLDWVIQGGESGEGARHFDLTWARDLRDACRHAKVPYFLKQLGAKVVDRGRPVKLHDPHGGEWNEWPRDLRVREIPTR